MQSGNGNKMAVVMRSGNTILCSQTRQNLVEVTAVLVLFLLIKHLMKKLLNMCHLIISVP